MDVVDGYSSLPVVTRVYVTLVVITSVLCALDVRTYIPVAKNDAHIVYTTAGDLSILLVFQLKTNRIQARVLAIVDKLFILWKHWDRLYIPPVLPDTVLQVPGGRVF